MLVDANVLLYAVDEASPFHGRASRWLEDAVNGPRRVGLPWVVLTAFLRIATHPRALAEPLSPREATAYVNDWLDTATVWTPGPTERHGEVLTDLIVRYDLRANLVPDAHLAALAIEHGLEIVSADTDFARFAEVRWTDPVSPR